MHPDETASILLVGGRLENLLALEQMLDVPGLRIFKATSGDEALGLMGAKDFALVLLDVQTPGLDALVTAKSTHAGAGIRHVPMVLITALNEAPRRVFKGYEAGAFDCLRKPFEPEVLRSKVRVFVDLYRQKKSLLQAIRKRERTIERLERSESERKRAGRKAEAAAGAKSDSPDGMSREIRDRLDTIAGMVGLLKETPLSAKQMEYVRILGSSFESLVGHIEDILGFNKTDSGRMALDRAGGDRTGGPRPCEPWKPKETRGGPVCEKAVPSRNARQGAVVIRVDPELKEIIPDFLESTREDIRAMRAAFERKDFDTLRLLGHSMKGASGCYGFNALSQMGSFIEEAAKGGDSDTVGKCLEELSTYLERVEVVCEPTEKTADPVR